MPKEQMAKKMLIDATHAEETRVVVVDGNKVEEFDFESLNKRQLAGNIYLAKVTRVEPSLQAAFVDYGGNRHGFLAFSEIHPDYYQIPVADREALLADERAYAEALNEAAEAEEKKPNRRRRGRGKPRPEAMASNSGDEDAVVSEEIVDDAVTDAEVVAEEKPVKRTRKPRRTKEQIAADKEAAAIAKAEKAAAKEAAKAAKEAKKAAAKEAKAKAKAEKNAPAKDAEVSEAAPVEKTADKEIGGMGVIDLDGDDDQSNDEMVEGFAKDDGVTPADLDENIESVADEDVSEEIRTPRKPRPKRYRIQEVIKVRQILLVQVVKEERGNKGAALTTYLSLAGRYCVLMPNTARGGGISRKITNAADRKKLKEIATEIEVPQGAGLIVRTAGAKRTKSEIKRDYEYLQRLWEEIRALTLKSIAPAKIYEEGNLIKRSIRDLYNGDIDEVFVEGENGYLVAKEFMKMLMPTHAKNVRHYQDKMPLFARYQVESYLAGMFNPTVQLKSGGYIVIGITEALVAIDVNSGRATKESSIEETAVKTNLEAAEEVARQLRLRDLAGLIVIDFIDMEDRRNNAAVEKRIKDRLKTDRARIQIGRISGFGLMEMSRQRLRPGMLEATTQPCPSCHGTGLVRSDDSLALLIIRQLEEEGVKRKSKEVLVKAPIAIANFMMNEKREHIATIEGRYGLSIRIEADPFLISPDFTIERFKTATRNVVEVEAPVISIDTADLPDLVEKEITDAVVVSETPEGVEGEGEAQPKKKRRRRRRRRGGGNNNNENGNVDQNAEGQEAGENQNNDQAAEVNSSDAVATDETSAGDNEQTAEANQAETNGDDAEQPVKKRPARRPRRSRKKNTDNEVSSDTAAEAPVEGAEAALVEETATATAEPVVVVEETAPETAVVPEPVVESTPEPTPEPVAESVPEPVAPEPEVPAKPKRRGWWSRG
ncbi:ribonuclease, Rne/Rng family protein [Rhodobacteraceae bacterium HTCC2150]|nr:ribonuclease, Rne/Rng family protein [Rhodobacteraceae bacterium HTCC2150]